MLLVNKLADDPKYPVLNRVKITIPVQMQLSMKQKAFSKLFAAFLISELNFEHFENEDAADSSCVSEITDSENVVR